MQKNAGSLATIETNGIGSERVKGENYKRLMFVSVYDGTGTVSDGACCSLMLVSWF